MQKRWQKRLKQVRQIFHCKAFLRRKVFPIQSMREGARPAFLGMISPSLQTPPPSTIQQKSYFFNSVLEYIVLPTSLALINHSCVLSELIYMLIHSQKLLQQYKIDLLVIRSPPFIALFCQMLFANKIG